MDPLKVTAFSTPKPEPRVSMSNSNSLIHMDFLGEGYSDAAVKAGDIKGHVVYLEYEPFATFCNIKSLGDIPNIDLEECVEIYDTETYSMIEEIKLKDLLTCPCVLHTQRIYGLDLQNLSREDFSRHSCRQCLCCMHLTTFMRNIRYKISPLYQPIPTFRPDPIVLYNLEQKFWGERVKRFLYDLSATPSESMRYNASNISGNAGFKLPISKNDIRRPHEIIWSGDCNGVRLDPGNHQLVAPQVRRQKELLEKWHGKEWIEKHFTGRKADER